MKILVISQQYFPDNFRINDICKQLVDMGHQVKVVTSLPDYETSKIPKEYKWFRKRKEMIDGVRVRRLWSVARHQGTIFRILNYISFMISGYIYASFAKLDFDVIYYWQPTPITSGSCAKKFKKRSGKKLVLYCLDLWPESLKAWGFTEDSLPYKLMLKYSKGIYKCADTLVVSSSPFKSYLTDVIGADEDKILYLPQHFEADYSEVADNYPEKRENINLLFAGNIGKAQDMPTIIKAAELLKDKPNIKFNIVGDGSELENCKTMVNELGLSDTVIFHGRKPFSQMIDYYKDADAFLLTLEAGTLISLTLPGKLQGYMAAGRPIFAAIDGAAKDVIADSDCGYCADGGDYEKLAEYIREYAENYDDMKNKGKNSKEYFDKNFTTKIHMDKLEQLLSK